MDAVWNELIRAVPWGTVIIILRLLDIREKAEERKERDANAKEKSLQDRETSQLIAKSYADAINTLARSVVDMTSRTESSIKEFKEAVLQQYESMKITQDLLDAAKKELTRRNKS